MATTRRSHQEPGIAITPPEVDVETPEVAVKIPRLGVLEEMKAFANLKHSNDNQSPTLLFLSSKPLPVRGGERNLQLRVESET